MSAHIQQTLSIPELPGVEHLDLALQDGSIHVATMGQGAPVLLLHGFGQSWWEWRDVMPALAATGHRVIAPDLRGEGWSTLPIAALTRTRRAEDISQLLDVLDLESVAVVGHDLGAIAAYQLAFEQPARVRKLAMMAVPPPQMKFDPALLPGLRHLWHQEALAIPWLGRKLMSTGIMSRHFYSEIFLTRALNNEVFAQYDALMRQPMTARAAELVCRRIVLPELARILGGSYRKRSLSMPTLFVFGKQDAGFPTTVLESVFAVPETIGANVSLELLEGTGHFLVDEEPVALARALAEFLEK